jgi:hypothetical protein
MFRATKRAYNEHIEQTYIKQEQKPMKKTFTPMYKNQRSKINVSLQPVPAQADTETPAPVEVVEVKEPTKAEKVQELIDGAQGADEYFKTSAFAKNIFHTDSLNCVCKEAGAFWFLDIIVSRLPKIIKKYGRRAEFQVWKMQINRTQDGTSIINVRITCEDGDGNTFAVQVIPYTDFPLDTFTVFCEYGSLDGRTPAFIIMLPGDR